MKQKSRIKMFMAFMTLMNALMGMFFLVTWVKGITNKDVTLSGMVGLLILGMICMYFMQFFAGEIKK